MILEVTPEDVRLATEQRQEQVDGNFNSGAHCPIARAAKRMLGEHVEAGVYRLWSCFGIAQVLPYYSKRLQREAARFDRHKGFRPGRYRLTRI